MIEDICSICSNEDFGYCSLRNKPGEQEYQYDKDGNLIKCSGFTPSIPDLIRIFKIEEK